MSVLTDEPNQMTPLPKLVVARAKRVITLRMPPQKPEVTVEQVTWAVAAVVREAGYDHSYTSPRVARNGMHLVKYIHNGKGDCIVGRVFLKLGFSPEVITHFENKDAETLVHHLISGPDKVKIGQALRQAQIANDKQENWLHAEMAYMAYMAGAR